MEWPKDDFDFVQKLVKLADGNENEQKGLFDYGPLIFPRLVDIVCRGNASLRAGGLDALCRLIKVRRLGRTLVSALCSESGLCNSEFVVRRECAAGIGRVLQSCIGLAEEVRSEIGWIRVLPHLVRISEESRTAQAAEQALVQLRAVLGKRNFLRRLTRALLNYHKTQQRDESSSNSSSVEYEHKTQDPDVIGDSLELETNRYTKKKNQVSWTLWRLYCGELEFLENSVDALEVIATTIEANECSRFEIIQHMLPLLDCFDSEISDGALNALVAHFDVDTCWELVSSHPLANTILEKSGAGRDSQVSKFGEESDRSHSPVLYPRKEQQQYIQSQQQQHQQQQQEPPKLKTQKSMPLLSELESQNSWETPTLSSTFDSIDSSRQPKLTRSHSISGSFDSGMGENQHGSEASPWNSAFTQSAPDYSPSMHSSTGLSSPRTTRDGSNNVFASAGNSMVKMNAQLSTLKRRTSGRRRQQIGYGSTEEITGGGGGGTQYSKNDLVMAAAQGAYNQNNNNSYHHHHNQYQEHNDHQHHQYQQQQYQHLGQPQQSPTTNSLPSNSPKGFTSKELKQNMMKSPRTPRQVGAIPRQYSAPPTSSTRNEFEDSDEESETKKSTTSKLGIKKKNRAVASASARHSQEEYPSGPVDIPSNKELPNNIPGLVRVLTDESEWQMQLHALNAIKGNQHSAQLPYGCHTDPSLIKAVVKLTSSLRSNLSKNSLLCLHHLISNNGALFWKDQSAGLIDSIVKALVKKSTDSSAFLAQEARASIEAAVECFPPSKLCTAVLQHCNANPNANARAFAAQALVEIVRQHSSSAYDYNLVVQCAKNKLLHDNTVPSRAAAKVILTHLDEIGNLDKKQQTHLHRIKVDARGPGTVGNKSALRHKMHGNKYASSSSSSSFSTNKGCIDAHMDLVQDLRSNSWQIRLKAIERCQDTLLESCNPLLFEHVAEKAADPNVKVKLKAIDTVRSVAPMYAAHVPPEKLSTLLLPVANACGDKASQRAAVECINSFSHKVDVTTPMKRHLSSLPPKARSVIERLI